MGGPTRLLGHRGHRCAGWEERENSLAAFDRALAAGCDGLELDLRHTADGRVAIEHNPELHFNGHKFSVAANTLRSLRRLQPELATLEQVLRRYRRRAWMDLELKTMGAAAPTIELLRRYPPQRGFVVSCFDAAVLHRVAELAPELPRCLNLKRPCSLRRIRGAEVSWVAPHQASCTAWYVRWLQQHGWRVLVWTVNHPGKMRLLVRAGADAICSDLPELLIATLRDEAGRATDAAMPASSLRNEQRNYRHPAASGTTGRVVSEP